jgi:hypothetical protein
VKKDLNNPIMELKTNPKNQEKYNKRKTQEGRTPAKIK